MRRLKVTEVLPCLVLVIVFQMRNTRYLQSIAARFIGTSIIRYPCSLDVTNKSCSFISLPNETVASEEESYVTFHDSVTNHVDYASTASMVMAKFMGNQTSHTQAESSFRQDDTVQVGPRTSIIQHPNNIQPSKPYMIIHVGPPKTGTTTLQFALSKLEGKGILKRDHYNYDETGVLGSVMDHKCHVQLVQVREHHNGTDANDLGDVLRQVECWKTALDQLEPYKNNHTNLIGSAEPWSTTHSTVYTKSARTQMVDWESIHLTLSQDWNIVVVFGYRRVPEWMASRHQQRYRWMPHKPVLNSWPTKRKAPGAIKPLKLPTTHQELKSYLYLFRYSNSLKEEMERQPHLSYAILNMHRTDLNFVSTFVCDILPNALNTCQYVEKNPEEFQGVANPSQSTFYDAIACEAAFTGLIDGNRYNRHKVVLAFKKYHEETLKLGPFDFPLIDLPRETLENILNFSLAMELEVVPEFATFPGVKEAHVASFWKSVERHKFSWVDTQAAIQNITWQSFFAQYK